MLKTFPLSFWLVRIEVESAEERHKMELAPTPMVHTPPGYFGLLNEILLELELRKKNCFVKKLDNIFSCCALSTSVMVI